jgi:hypothetical protein
MKKVLYTLEICLGDCEFSESVFLKFDDLMTVTAASESAEQSKSVLYTEITKTEYG